MTTGLPGASQPRDPGRVVLDRAVLAALQAEGVEPGLAEVDADDPHPPPPPCLRPCAGQPFGLERRRGGTVLGRGLPPGVRSGLRPRAPLPYATPAQD
jgi:hypothetical protein